MQQSFGHSMRELFLMKPDYLNANHGSYGVVPKIVFDKKIELLRQLEAVPDHFYRFQAEDQLKQVIKEASVIMNCNESDLFVVQSASDAMNSIFKNIKWENGDTLIITNTTYKMVAQLAKHLQKEKGIKIKKIEFTQNDFVSKETIINKYKEVIKQIQDDEKVKAIVIDHISSAPSIQFPVQQLISLFKELNIQVIIDGAHAINQVEIDINSLNPDFYFTNVHKWAFGCKTSTLLYIKKEHQEGFHPNIISNYYNQCLFKEFFWPGTTDLTTFLSISESFVFIEKIGGFKNIQNYCNNLAEQIVILAKSLGYKALTYDSSLMCYMVNLQIESNTNVKIEQIQQEFFQKHKIYLQLFRFDNQLWLRLSATVYNEIEDYQKVFDILDKNLKNYLN